MSSDKRTLAELVREDFADTPLTDRLQTMLLTLAIGAFGFMLGVHWFASQAFNALMKTSVFVGELGLQTTYTEAMWTGATVSVACFTLAVFVGRYAET
jgi:hypothetical protein